MITHSVSLGGKIRFLGLLFISTANQKISLLVEYSTALIINQMPREDRLIWKAFG